MASEVVLKIIFFSLILLAVVLEVIGDIFIKRWSIDGRYLLLYLGVIIYTKSPKCSNI